MVLRHEDALEAENVRVVAESRFVYLGGGSPLHLRSVLKGSPLYDALVAAWRGGAVVAGSSAGAMVLCDPMVDPRGGAFTVGLGLVEQLAVVPHHKPGGGHLLWRTLELAPAGVPLAGIPERTVLLREPDGTWRAAGAAVDDVTIYVDGKVAGLEDLPS
jgi:cyanophycinase